MKICAIAGSNLASLGKFEIDLESGPLANTGLFAITGPTGAGKSTILDAVCLALYDRIPRLAGHQKYKIGYADQDEKNRDKSDDVKTIMRKGTGSCFAQVDFVGVDNIKYSARWSASRARGNAGGRLQKQTVELTNLNTDEKYGGTKSEILTSINEKVGLTFDQFRRAVLLAQGDFAAFLKAGDTKRAQLLERMTGTDIYARLSGAAFERCKEELEKLAQLSTRREVLGILSIPERAQIEGEILGAGFRVKELGSDRSKLEIIIRSSEKVGELNKRVEQEIIEVEKIEQRIKQESQTLESAELQLQKFMDINEKALQKFDDVQPDVDEAKLLDKTIDEAQKDFKRLQKVSVETKNNLLSLEQQQEDLKKKLSREQQALEDLKKWFASKGDLEQLERGWERCKVDLVNYADAQSTLSDLKNKYSDVEQEQEECKSQLDKRTLDLNDFKASLQAAQKQVIEAEQAMKAISRDELSATLGDLLNKNTLVEKAISIIEKYWQQVEQRDEFILKIKSLTIEQEQAKNKTQEAKRDLEIFTARIDEAEESLKAADDAAGLKAKRAELKEGTPCPLCGSPTHPWFDGSPIEGFVAQRRKRVKELKAQEMAQIEANSTAAQQAKSIAREIGNLEVRKQESDAGICHCEDSWLDLKSNINFNVGDLKDPDAKAQCISFKEQTAVERDKNKNREAQLNGLEQAAVNTRKERDKIIELKDSALKQVAKIEDKKNNLQKQMTQLEAKIDKNDHIMASALDVATPLLENRPGFMDDLRSDPKRLVKEIDREVGKYNENRSDKDRLSGSIFELTPLVAANCEKLNASKQSRDKAVKDEREAKHRLESIGEKRAGLLEGMGTVRFLEKMQERIRDTKSSVDSSMKNMSDANTRLATTRGSLDVKKQAQQKQKHELDEQRELLANQRRNLEPLLKGQDVQESLRDVNALLDQTTERLRLGEFKIEQDDAAIERSRQLDKQINTQEEKTRLWQTMNELIGSHDGSKFRKFAQGVTLGSLVAQSNVHLAQLSPRYSLEQVPGHDLELQIVDKEMGDEVRAVGSLSGGESFLVSLALALGLASMSSTDVSIESLFIDEGFGTLDPATLEIALSALDGLQATGRKVGIISHVHGLSDQISAQVCVKKVGAGRSTVTTLIQ